jgi:DNA adenine methylase
MNIPKPLIKWVGGKTQILDKLLNNFPKEINSYHEIFLGGGSVLLGFLTYIKQNKINIQNKIYAYDINEPLIHMYINIQTKHNELYDKLREFIIEYNEADDDTKDDNNEDNTKKNNNRKPKNIEEAKSSKESYYYWMREKYNKLGKDDKKNIVGSALFIFLNKTCFRGLYRLNNKGQYNTPYGNYKNPEIINKVHLDTIHSLIQNVIFQVSDFELSINNIGDGDFTYLDPPYSPEDNTSFVKYTEYGFNLEIHKKLFGLCNKISLENKKIIMSNSDVELVRENFKNSIFKIESIECKRTINSKKPDAKAKEVIIKNF